MTGDLIGIYHVHTHLRLSTMPAKYDQGQSEFKKIRKPSQSIKGRTLDDNYPKKFKNSLFLRYKIIYLLQIIN